MLPWSWRTTLLAFRGHVEWCVCVCVVCVWEGWEWKKPGKIPPSGDLYCCWVTTTHQKLGWPLGTGPFGARCWNLGHLDFCGPWPVPWTMECKTGSWNKLSFNLWTVLKNGCFFRFLRVASSIFLGATAGYLSCFGLLGDLNMLKYWCLHCGDSKVSIIAPTFSKPTW